jgi:EAL domain-containing protein (putative c-di-GMP-specific phosphodiesterase class I)/GGDEF domain-containing protein
MHFGITSLIGRSTPPRKLPKSVSPDRAGILAASADSVDLPERDLDEEIRQLMLRYGQRFDIQTRLMNQQTFQAALAELLRNCPADQEIALIWIDVLNLRREFALSGSRGVEALVVHIADSLRSAVDSDALLGRFGARAFLVAMPASKLDRGDRLRIQMTVDALEPMRVLGAEIRPTIAAGVAFYPADANSDEELVRFASLAASRAGGARNASVMTFDSGMNSLLLRDHQLEVEIRKGLDENQFRVYYQPKVDLITGQVLGAEALMRWNHPEWGPVPLSEVIPVAERSNLIHRIFEFGLRTALWDARRWRDRGSALPVISVNVSPANLRRDDFARLLSDIQTENSVAPTKLELEVTESMLLEDEELFIKRLRQVNATGASIAIDDFGTRYTGFNMLRQLPLSSMKIDQCFIQGIDRSQEMQSLCHTIVAMARQLKLQTVAEGIETQGELRVMREIGCEAGQGYLFQRPLPAEEFHQFLTEWPTRKRSCGFADAYQQRYGM